MTTLVSAGVDVPLIDQSFYIPAGAGTVPLIIIATAAEKTQADGTTAALGTYESGVVRTVTSGKQAAELYGVPKFYTDASGNPLHGDVRNEYGLDALAKFLELSNRAYVLRANINLNDDLEDIKALWTSKISEAADYLNTLVTAYITEYNDTNGLVPTDTGYKESVTTAELKTLVDEAMVDVFAFYSFNSTAFSEAFIQDHTVAYPGYQDVLFETTAGYIIGTDATGLQNDTTAYGFEADVVSTGGTDSIQISVQGQNAQTFTALITALNTAVQAATSSSTTVELVQGKIRITSDLTGATSSVEITSDGYGGTTALFSSLNLFDSIDTPVAGKGVQTLSVYNDDYTTVVDSYEGMDSLIDAWTSGSIISTEFTPSEAEGLLLTAAAEFDNTKEFKNETSLGANDAAKRAEVVKQLTAIIKDPNVAIRTEAIEYSLVVCPGFPEVTNELNDLSTDLKEEVFVIGETPFDKAPTGPNGLVEWAQSPSLVNSANVAYYYPHGLSSNIDGATILTTAASTMLRVYAYSDDKGEQWYAPAGPTRGVITNLDAIGYVSGTLGTATEFVENMIDEGTRDELTSNKINPISFINGRGIIVMGQKTTYGLSSALDRVNVSRLTKYIKRSLRKNLFAYLFEPNDEITRKNAKATADSFLADLMGRRGLYDFATLCDESNNYGERIDRNELWIDVAIKPVKAVEFIYVPVTIARTDANLGTGR
jgi:hypothetical protein